MSFVNTKQSHYTVFVCFAVMIMPTYIAPLADELLGRRRQGALSNPRVRGPFEARVGVRPERDGSSECHFDGELGFVVPNVFELFQCFVVTMCGAIFICNHSCVLRSFRPGHALIIIARD